MDRTKPDQSLAGYRGSASCCSGGPLKLERLSTISTEPGPRVRGTELVPTVSIIHHRLSISVTEVHAWKHRLTERQTELSHRKSLVRSKVRLRHTMLFSLSCARGKRGNKQYKSYEVSSRGLHLLHVWCYRRRTRKNVFWILKKQKKRKPKKKKTDKTLHYKKKKSRGTK